MAAPPPRRRADQLRNRHRILPVARGMFARIPASDIQMEDLEKAAGVGRATLFRHIGSKDALVREIYRDRAGDLAELGARALACPDPWDGVDLAFRTMARWMHDDRGLFDFSRGIATDGSRDTEIHEAITGWDAVLERARAAGVLWGDLRAADLLPLLAYAVEPSPDRLEPLTDILLRGLRA